MRHTWLSNDLDAWRREGTQTRTKNEGIQATYRGYKWDVLETSAGSLRLLGTLQQNTHRVTRHVLFEERDPKLLQQEPYKEQKRIAGQNSVRKL